MQSINDSFPHHSGKEFLFCGLSGIPVEIRSWRDNIEVPTSLLGYGGGGYMSLNRLTKSSSVNIETSGVLDTRRVLTQKVETLKEIGLDVEISTLNEVWSDGAVIDGVADILKDEGNILSHAYVLDKKVIFCTPYGDVVDAIDDVVILRHALRVASDRLKTGLSFMPISGGGRCGVGLNFLIKGDREKVISFCAGMVLHSPECTVFTNSSHPSYVRLNSAGCAHYVCYGKSDGALFHIEFSQDGARVGCDYLDNTGNPYLVVASLLEGAIMGVEHQVKLPDEVDELNPTVTSKLVRLPMSLKEALFLSEGSGFLKRVLGESHANTFFTQKSIECKAFDTVVGEGEYAVYYSKLIKKY